MSVGSPPGGIERKLDSLVAQRRGHEKAEVRRSPVEFPDLSGETFADACGRLRIDQDSAHLDGRVGVPDWRSRRCIPPHRPAPRAGLCISAYIRFSIRTFLNAAEEGICCGVVPTVALPAHAGPKPDRLARSAQRIDGVLRALVGVNQRSSRPAAAHSHQYGVDNEFAVDGPPVMPRDLARMQINYPRGIGPALPCANVSGVSHHGPWFAA